MVIGENKGKLIGLSEKMMNGQWGVPGRRRYGTGLIISSFPGNRFHILAVR
jgi:hypothetical protein